MYVHVRTSILVPRPSLSHHLQAETGKVWEPSYVPQGCTQRADHLQLENPLLEKTGETRERERERERERAQDYGPFVTTPAVWLHMDCMRGGRVGRRGGREEGEEGRKGERRKGGGEKGREISNLHGFTEPLHIF